MKNIWRKLVDSGIVLADVIIFYHMKSTTYRVMVAAAAVASISLFGAGCSKSQLPDQIGATPTGTEEKVSADTTTTVDTEADIEADDASETAKMNAEEKQDKEDMANEEAKDKDLQSQE